jgi:hypothetical protein
MKAEGPEREGPSANRPSANRVRKQGRVYTKDSAEEPGIFRYAPKSNPLKV